HEPHRAAQESYLTFATGEGWKSNGVAPEGLIPDLARLHEQISAPIHDSVGYQGAERMVATWLAAAEENLGESSEDPAGLRELLELSGATLAYEMERGLEQVVDLAAELQAALDARTAWEVTAHQLPLWNMSVLAEIGAGETLASFEVGDLQDTYNDTEGAISNMLGRLQDLRERAGRRDGFGRSSSPAELAELGGRIRAARASLVTQEARLAQMRSNLEVLGAAPGGWERYLIRRARDRHGEAPEPVAASVVGQALAASYQQVAELFRRAVAEPGREIWAEVEGQLAALIAQFTQLTAALARDEHRQGLVLEAVQRRRQASLDLEQRGTAHHLLYESRWQLAALAHRLAKARLDWARELCTAMQVQQQAAAGWGAMANRLPR
ncbi:MAG: hypothetical protein ACRC0L_01885, partial [Angustibacter sp.]